MIKSFRRSVAVVAAVSALAVAAPTVASADQFFLDDEVGDVWQGVETRDGFDIRKAGSVTNADLTRVRVAHSDRKVKVWADYVDLKRVNDDLVIFALTLRTNEKVRRDAVVLNLTRRGIAFLSNRRGREIECRGLRAEIQWPQDQFEIDVPRRCMSRPTWVQFHALGGALTDVFAGDPESGDASVYVDVAGQKSWRGTTWSPKLFRG